jgi:hypothetical protein
MLFFHTILLIALAVGMLYADGAWCAFLWNHIAQRFLGEYLAGLHSVGTYQFMAVGLIFFAVCNALAWMVIGIVVFCTRAMFGARATKPTVVNVDLPGVDRGLAGQLTDAELADFIRTLRDGGSNGKIPAEN